MAIQLNIPFKSVHGLREANAHVYISPSYFMTMDNFTQGAGIILKS